ncbi:MAG: D-alanyl-D-alanine carboxypeptidase family protein [Desulfobulbus sp.]|jgi:D-alanyl-D-alanine carboxypeptidase (penicillin-binding protein 5/6)
MKRVCCLFAVVCLLTLSVQDVGAAPKPLSRDPYLSALVLDADTGKVLFEDRADTTVYPASVLKLMGLYVVLDRVEKGLLRLDEMVPVSREAARTGGSQVYLDPREQFSVDEMLYALMVQSANDAAVALAEHISGSKEGFVMLMNQKAKELGMNNTTFHSVHGLPPGKGQSPDVTTARDLAILCRALVQRPDALRYTSTQVRGFREDKFIMRNHNKLLTRMPGCDGLKTGYYQAAGFSIAATAKKNGVRILALVMGSADRKVRDAKAIELLGKGFAVVPPRPEAPAPAEVPAAAGVTTAAPSDTAPAEGTPPATAEKSWTWGVFFMGLGAGVLCLLAFLAIAALVLRRRASRATRIRPRRY